MPQRKEFSTLKERRNKITTLYSLPPRSDNVWKLKPRSEIDKISIVRLNKRYIFYL